MIEDMNNAQLIAHAKDGDDATELELELADRLAAAISEIDTLVTDLQRVKAAVEASSGEDA